MLLFDLYFLMFLYVSSYVLVLCYCFSFTFSRFIHAIKSTF